MTLRKDLADPADPRDREPRGPRSARPQNDALAPTPPPNTVAAPEDEDEPLDEGSARPLPDPQSEGRF